METRASHWLSSRLQTPDADALGGEGWYVEHALDVSHDTAWQQLLDKIRCRSFLELAMADCGHHGRCTRQVFPCNEVDTVFMTGFQATGFAGGI